MAVFFARMVMPRSRSWSLESITRSAPISLRARVPDCCSSLSTRVVLPWSTWAMMAMLRRFSILMEGYCGREGADYSDRGLGSHTILLPAAGGPGECPTGGAPDQAPVGAETQW